MTRVEFWVPAGTFEVPGKGEFAQKFAAHAFDGCIGGRVPLRSQPDGQVLSRGTVIAVTVDADGGGATWTVDTDVPVSSRADMPAMSFAFRELGYDLPRDSLAAREPEIRWACSGRPEDSP